ncbi:MAG: ImmA/IrrE family metallo-endopeptidase [Candidatus Pacebacteria bacterium]|nr:ImmA/IrrE family metallo-endopeptidase [Candidatus Paceibacterota bacterium]
MQILNKYQQIGQKIKQAREENNLTQSELAERLGFTKATMSLIEQGERKVAIHEIEKMVELFNKNLDYFLGKKKESAAPDLRFVLRADDNLSDEAKGQVLNFVEFIKNRDDSFRQPKIAIARNRARQIIKDMKISKRPIILKKILDKLGADLNVFSFDFSDEISGLQINSKNKDTIVYNKNHHTHRQRFTVAHELGHWLLGHTSKNGVSNLEDKRPSEIEANQFAAELLMPIAFLKADIKNIKNVEKLAQMYWVSEEAMWWRLRDLNLIKYL